MRDALGNKIIVGDRYGYSLNDRGFTHITIGTVRKENKEYVTLEVEETKRALCNGDFQILDINKKMIGVRSIMLFPLI